MANNHIIIGLGGRGGAALKSFRKILFRNALTKEKANSYPIQYLYVDSDPQDLNKGWDKDLGIDYGIDDWAKINTRENVEWEDIYENQSNYPTITPWLGDKSAWQELSVKTEKGSGQLRKLGRAYFAASVYNDRDNAFPKNLQIAYENVCKISGSSAQTTYHIIAGLSGGTGSGSVVDVISLVSKHISANSLNEDRIVVYAYLPERNVQGKDSLGYYYPNAYAALKEINAIGIRAESGENKYHYKPIDIQEFTRGSGNRIDAQYTSCFVFSNENENNLVIDYDNELPEMIGDFLYQSVVNLPLSKEGHDAYKKLTENSTIISELDKFSGEKERALNFASASVKKVEIPEMEVVDLYGAWLAQQFLNQQYYNNWSDGKGYIDKKGEDVTVNYVEKSGKDNILKACNLTLDYLSLKTPHGSEDFKNADSEFLDISETLKRNSEKVYTSGKEKEPIMYFNNYMNGFYSSQFRGIGVEKYWHEKSQDINQQIDFFYKRTEEYLFDLWISKGDRVLGINELNLIVDRLKTKLLEISSVASRRVGHLTDPGEFDVTNADFTISGCNREISKLLVDFKKPLKSSKKAFESAAWFIQKLYTNKMEVVSYNFSIQLIDRLIKKFDELSVTIKKISANVLDANEKIVDTVSEKYKIFNPNNKESYRTNSVEMLYEKGGVEREFDIILNEQNILLDEFIQFRKLITNSRGASFSDLLNNMDSDSLTKGYLYHLNSRIPQIYKLLEEVGKIKGDDKLVGRNVLNYFQNSFSKDELASYFKNLSNKSGVYAKLSSTKSETLDTTSLKNYASDIYIILVPKYKVNEKAEEFEQEFKSMLKQTFPNSEIVVSPDAQRNNSITIFKARANMALRSFDIVSKMMHDKYETIFMNDFKTAALTLHTEGSSNNYPKIVPFNDNQKEGAWNKMFKAEVLPYFLLAYGIGYVGKDKGKYFVNMDPDNASSTEFFDISNGTDKFYEIGNFLFKNDILEEKLLDDRLYNILTKRIEEFINIRSNKKAEVREIWVNKINTDIIPSILAEDYENDKMDKEYHAVLQAKEYLVETILK
ncbi:tubulin-like doman-containing protein [Ancylomarina sp. YFZ004]